MNSRKIFAGLACGAMALSMTACGGSGDAKKGGDSNGGGTSGDTATLIVGNTQQLSGVFSPIYYQSSYDGWIVDLVYQSMGQYNENSELEPWLATEIPEMSEDGKTVTFKLKEGAKFSDGSDLTAQDVKFTFTLMADPSYDGRFVNNVDFIEGYSEYHDGDAKEVSGIEVVDDTTITFHLKDERIDALPTLATQMIMSDTQFEYTKGNLGGYKDNTDQPLGSNAYKLNTYEKATGASLVKNENYTGEGEYKIPRVIYKTIAEAQEVNSLTSGDINYFPESIEADIIGPATMDENITFNEYFRAAEGFMGFNCGDGATADKAVRQALSYATPRQEFVNDYFKFKEGSEEVKKVPLGYVPDIYWNPVSSTLGKIVTGEEKLDGLTIYDYDLDKAKQVLDDAGWKPGADGIREKDGQRLEVKFLASEGNSVLDSLLPKLIKSWGDIGVDLKQTTVDFNTLRSIVTPSTGDKTAWNCFFMATSYTGVSNSDSVMNLGAGDENNYSLLDNKELTEKLKAAQNTTDEAKSVELYKECMLLENDEIPYLPIYGNHLFNLYAKNIKGMETGPVRCWAQAMDTAYIE